MVVQLRPRAITVERGSRGFGLSLIYRGLDKYEEKDTGIFVARVVPGGMIFNYQTIINFNDSSFCSDFLSPKNYEHKL
jgi:hypothetical protein